MLKKYNPKETVLLVSLKEGDTVLAENNCYLSKVKELNLPHPEIRYEVAKEKGGYTVKLTSDVLAKNVYIETANNGFLSDNFFDLYPGRSVTVAFDGKETPEIIRIYSLADSF